MPEEPRDRDRRLERDRLERDIEDLERTIALLTEAVRKLAESVIVLRTEFTLVKAIVFGFAVIILTSFAGALAYTFIPRTGP